MAGWTENYSGGKCNLPRSGLLEQNVAAGSRQAARNGYNNAKFDWLFSRGLRLNVEPLDNMMLMGGPESAPRDGACPWSPGISEGPADSLNLYSYRPTGARSSPRDASKRMAPATPSAPSDSPKATTPSRVAVSGSSRLTIPATVAGTRRKP